MENYCVKVRFEIKSGIRTGYVSICVVFEKERFKTYTVNLFKQRSARFVNGLLPRKVLRLTVRSPIVINLCTFQL
jgi:hypothetical protein